MAKMGSYRVQKKAEEGPKMAMLGLNRVTVEVGQKLPSWTKQWPCWSKKWPRKSKKWPRPGHNWLFWAIK